MARERRHLYLGAILALIVVLLQPAMAAATPGDPPTLVAIRAAHHVGFDRIVFEFKGGMPEVTRARWVDELRLEPSDRAAHVQGNAFIRVRFRYALGHRETAPQNRTFGPARRAYDLPNIAHVVLLGDSEGQVTLGIGLMARTKIIRATRLRHPSRFVVDISSRYPKGKVKVFFADKKAIADGGSTILQAVTRKVPRGERARGAMQRLYAGPTGRERGQGLRFIASGTTGFRDLRINRWGVARVTLKGPCDSGGSALVTVADEVISTLRSRPAVDFVKIYDRNGVTEEPTGRTDSIPYCLEP